MCHRGKELVYSQSQQDRQGPRGRPRRVRASARSWPPSSPTSRTIAGSLPGTTPSLGLSLEERNAERGRRSPSGKPWTSGIRLRKDFPEVPGDWYGRAESHHWLGSLLTHTGRLPEAEQELRKALALAERALAADPEDTDFRAELAQIQDYLGHALMREGREAEAEDHFRRSIRIYESLMEDFPDTPGLSAAVVCLVLVQSRASHCGRWADSRRRNSSLRRAIELAEDMIPVDRIRRCRLGAPVRDSWAWSFTRSGRDQDAVDAFRQARARYERADAEVRTSSGQKFVYARFLHTVRPPSSAIRNEPSRWRSRHSSGHPSLAGAGKPSGRPSTDPGTGRPRSRCWRARQVRHEGRSGRGALPGHGALATGPQEEARKLYDQAVGWLERAVARSGPARHCAPRRRPCWACPVPRHRPGGRSHALEDR